MNDIRKKHGWIQNIETGFGQTISDLMTAEIIYRKEENWKVQRTCLAEDGRAADGFPLWLEPYKRGDNSKANGCGFLTRVHESWPGLVSPNISLICRIVVDFLA